MNSRRAGKSAWPAVAFVSAVFSFGVLFLCLHRDRHPPKPPPPALTATAGNRIPAKISGKSKRDARAGISSEELSSAVRKVCGIGAAANCTYAERNSALRIISGMRNLPKGDADALMGYICSSGGVLRAEREAALKNDVMNLLRKQNPTPKGFPDILVSISCGSLCDEATTDYAVQHLGAVLLSTKDNEGRDRIRRALAAAAAKRRRAYAGTALYALAGTKELPRDEERQLRRMTISAFGRDSHPLARMAAIQLAGQRGYVEALPTVRGIIDGKRRDAVLDIVAVGTLGLLGDRSDLKRLDAAEASFGVRIREAVRVARKRIGERTGG